MDSSITLLWIQNDTSPGSNFESVRFDSTCKEGVKVIRAGSTELGIRLLAESPDVQAVVIDLRLQEGGEAAFREIIQVTLLPILLYSQAEDEDLASRLIDQGAQDFLIQGQFDCPGLIRSVRHAISRQATAAALNDRNREIQLLYEAGQVLSQTLDLDKLYQIFMNILLKLMPCDHLFISGFDAATQMISAVFAMSDQMVFDASTFPSIPLEPEGKGIQSQVIRTGQPLLSNDWQTMIARVSNAYYIDEDGSIVHRDDMAEEEDTTQSGIIVPIIFKEQVVGAIQILSNQKNAYHENHLRIAQALAAQIAVAANNALLYNQARIEINERKLAGEMLQKSQASLEALNRDLEKRVEARTAELRESRDKLSAANAALENASRLKDEFLASMSHELRTPLTGILGLSEALQLQTYGVVHEKQLKALRLIESSGRHLLDLINDILDLSKIGAGKLDIHIETCSVAEISQASLQLIKGLASQKQQKVAYSIEPQAIVLRADPRRLKQMLINLLGNAVKFTPQGGSIGLDVRLDQTDQVVRFSIWDSGIGIAPEDLGKLFQPFMQLDSSLARQYSGTGLGLLLVQRMAELHGGSVTVESTPGAGSRFTISLPWHPDTDASLEENFGGTGQFLPEPLSSRQSPIRVMLADDNETILETLTDFLNAKGFEVAAVRSGSELLEASLEYRPDLFLVDIQMPGMDGMETIRRLRAHENAEIAKTPILAVTALAMSGDRERCLQAGADDYLSKPVHLGKLAEHILKLVSAPGKHTQ